MKRIVCCLFISFHFTLTICAQSSLTLSVSTQNTNCTASSNGSATVNASGCSGNYIYTWLPNVSSTNSATNLAAGSYTVTVTDTATSGTSSTDTLFQDDFDGSTKWILNSTIGTNDAQANKWVIDDYESWDGICGSGNLTKSGDKTLHVYCNSSYCSLIGTGAIYDAGGLLTKTTADVMSYNSLGINTIGYSNITLQFAYRCYGQSNKDYGSLRYSIDGGLTWTDLSNKYQLQTNWSCETVTLPSTCENIPDLRIAFRWRNNNDGNGKDPSFAIDDFMVAGKSSSMQSCSASQTFTIFALANNPTIIASYNTISGADTICPGDTLGLIATGGLTYNWTPSSTLLNFSTQMPYSFATTTTTYTVTGTDINGCQGSDSISVFVYPPSVTPTIIKKGDSLFTQAGYSNYQWYCNGSPLSNASNHYLVAQYTGAYYVSVTDNNGCLATSLALDITSIISNISSFGYPSIEVYPNPSKGEFMISIEEPALINQATLYLEDLLGREVYRNQLIPNQPQVFIQTKNVKPGIYSLCLSNNSGKFTIQKIVIEK